MGKKTNTMQGEEPNGGGGSKRRKKIQHWGHTNGRQKGQGETRETRAECWVGIKTGTRRTNIGAV